MRDPLGGLCWAAVGKDPGFTPLSLLELLKRRGRYRPEDFARLALTEPFDLVAAKQTWLAAARFPWHTHPGPVLVAVAEGDFTYVYADDCVQRPYPAGSAFVDPGFDNVHTGFNPHTEATVLIATFLGAPPTGMLTIAVDPAEEAALTAKCGLSPAPHTH